MDLSGQLLVASPSMQDPNFARAVIQVIRHDDEGAFGLILNRPTSLLLANVWQRIRESDCPREDLLYQGGPVPSALFALHTDPANADEEVVDGLFIAADLDLIEQVLGLESVPLKVFAGYSGWGAGQLEGEMSENSWMTFTTEGEHAFAPPETLWRDVVEAIGQQELFRHLPGRAPDQRPDWN